MTDVKLDLELAQQSLVFIFASMVVYTVSFLIFAWHLTNIASNKGSGRVTSTKLENIGFALLGFGALIHGAGVVMRGIAAARVPWANMYEFSISGAFVLVAIYLAFYRLRDIRIFAAFVNGFVLLILGAATTYFYVQVKTLMPALQSYWLVIHVTVAVLANRSYDIMWCEALAEKISIFHDQAGKSRPLFVFYKGGKEIARINEANGERKCPHEPPNARPLQCCPIPLPAV